MTVWAESCGAWWSEYLVSASCLLLLTWGGIFFVRQPSRRIAWMRMAVMGLIALGAISLWPSRPRLPFRFVELAVGTHSTPTTIADAQRSGISSIQGSGIAITPVVSEAIATDEPSSTALEEVSHWRRYVGFFFLLGSSTLLVRLLIGFCQVHRIRCLCAAAPENWLIILRELAGPSSSLPALKINQFGNAALALGVFRPAIVLPKRYLSVAPIRLRAVMAHELAHIRNRDLWLQAAIRWLFVLLFPLPPFWWLQRRIHECQEALADADAAETVGRDVLVAELRHLAKIASHESFGHVFVAGLAMAARRSQFYIRAARLLDDLNPVETRCPGAARWASLVAATTFTTLCAVSPFRIAPPELIAAPSIQAERHPSESEIFGPDGTTNRGLRLPPWGNLLVRGRLERAELPNSFRLTVDQPGPLTVVVIPLSERLHPMLQASWSGSTGEEESDADDGHGSGRGDRPLLVINPVRAYPENHIAVRVHARETADFSSGEYLLHIRQPRVAGDLDPDTLGIESSPIPLNRSGSGYLTHEPIHGKNSPAIDFPDDKDFFQVVAAIDGVITFATDAGSARKLQLRVFNAAGQQRDADTGGGVRGASRVTRQARRGDLFYVEVSSADETLGPYSVQVSQ